MQPIIFLFVVLLYVYFLLSRLAFAHLLHWLDTGELSINVIAVKASVHLPFDHRLLVQNLTAQVIACL